jgi:hypothetical protein
MDLAVGLRLTSKAVLLLINAHVRISRERYTSRQSMSPTFRSALPIAKLDFEGAMVFHARSGGVPWEAEYRRSISLVV